MQATMKREFAFTSLNNTINAMTLIMAVIGIVVLEANIATVFLMLTYSAHIMLQLWDFSTNSLRNYNRAFGDAEGMMGVLSTRPSVVVSEIIFCRPFPYVNKH